jgi:hypothetical protein
MSTPLPPHAANIARTLIAAGHQASPHPGTDGFELTATMDGRAVEVFYWSSPRNGHESLVGTHLHRRRSRLEDCERLLTEAGFPVARLFSSHAPHTAPLVMLVVFPGPEPEPEPVPELPAGWCGCTPPGRYRGEVCERAARRAAAAHALSAAVHKAGTGLLAGLHEASVELVSHPIYGTETAAALFAHGRRLILASPQPPDGAELRSDAECTGCASPACTAANAEARAALAAAEQYAAVRRTALAAAGAVLDQAQVLLTEKTTRDDVCTASTEISHVFTTTSAALGRPREERRWFGVRHRTTPVYYRRGGRRWFVSGRRATWQ